MGIDLNTCPANWTKYWIIAYGVYGKTSSIDPQNTYDYQTAFDIKPTQVLYNVDLDMNAKKILNITLDKTYSKSAATVKMVSDLETTIYPYTNNNVYREIFEHIYDFSDVSNCKLTIGVSGITFTGINPNLTFPQRTISNVEGNGIRFRGQALN